jgi:hypothetical protein
MRHAGNFNPEWGYIAPAPNFLRTTRLFVVAAAIGATASYRGRLLADGSAGGRDRRGAHVGAASGTGAAARRNVAQLQTQSDRPLSRRRSAPMHRAMRPQGWPSPRTPIYSRCERVGRCVDDAKPTIAAALAESQGS